jgi:hypothetical protein
MPAGFTGDGVPIGVELLARPFEEPRLISIAFAYEQAVRPRKPPARTPSLVSGRLTIAFALSGSEDLTGHALLDVPTQTLRYELQLKSVRAEEILDLKLHRGASDANGPVVALLGSDRRGEVAIRNEDLEALLAGNVYVALYTRTAPLGAAKARLTSNP